MLWNALYVKGIELSPMDRGFRGLVDCVFKM